MRVPGRFSRSLALALSLAAAPALAASEPPVLVALVLDTSGSLTPRDFARARELALGILDGLPTGSEVTVFTFDDQSRLIRPRTSDPEEVRRALARVAIQGRYTALHDALYDASRSLRESPTASKAIVLLTDGKDEKSSLNLDDGLKVAQENAIPVFAVGLGKVQERVLRRIAKLTGGRYFPSREATGAAVASRILESRLSGAPVAAAPAHPGLPEGASAPSTAAARTGPTAPAPPSAGRLWVLLGAAAFVVAGALAVGALRRRPPPRCTTCGRELPGPFSPCAFCSAAASEPTGTSGRKATAPADVSETVVARLNTTEEYLEKTITLRERPVLAVTRGPGSGQVFSLSTESATSVGRAKANDIVLEDVAVSSQHFRVRPEDGRFVLHDLKSTNGTFVNERRVSRHTLAEGDLVKAGETYLQFRTEQLRE